MDVSPADPAYHVDPEDSLQFFKEEKVEGAVYHLYHKKVRYHTPSDIDDPDDDCQSHLQWRIVEIRVIKTGTLEMLVEAVSMPNGEIDPSYVNVFLQTYRSFASTKEVLHLLLDRYKTVAHDVKMKQNIKEGHRKTLRTVISGWLDAYPEDFKEPPSYPTLRQLKAFAECHMTGTDLSHRAQHKIEKFQGEEETSPTIRVEDVQFNFTLLGEVDFMIDARNSLTRPVDFESIPQNVFAEQLTYMDSELFKKVVPHHCLGSVWSRRDKKRIDAPSVYATVNQFNAVSYRVIAMILKHPDIRRSERARIIEKWINIAEELRFLKNFSSLKAIISGLQSNPVYRLRKVWAELDRESKQLFDELSEIFSEENNQMMVRELLMKEGTAKFADMEPTNTISRRDRRKSHGGTGSRRRSYEYPTVQGTIPYLGTFLTDLTMIDTAIPDTNEEGHISFDKKRKEFEILAQIKLLQSAAQLYAIKPDPAFFEWFHNVRTYDDKESYELSCEIEAVTPTTPREVRGHRKKSSLGFFTPRRPISMDNLQVPSPDTSSSSFDGSIYSAPNTPDVTTPTLQKPSLRHSISMGSLRSMDSSISVSPWRCPETCIVKVSMDTDDSHETNYYKSIMLTNSDHTKNVIRNILIKFDISGKPEDYTISQVMPEREMLIPDKGNVFYAINNAVPEVKFLVRKKSDLDRIKAKHQKKKRGSKAGL